LYQGTTLVGPHRSSQISALGPGLFFCVLGKNTVHSRESFLDKHFVRDTPLAGAKALISGVGYGPTKVVP
jgi:hypothetical protein